jgi:type I restriction enzyme M protein
MCNPPFNGCEGRKLYPELFLRCIHSYFGSSLPVVLVVPMGFRLNQRRGSKRWQYLRDNWKISSIMTLPIDMFGDVLFHSEILFFNFPNGSLQPHYFYAEN